MAKNMNSLAEAIIKNVGGKGNITFLTHCMTRLRFNVQDKELVNKAAVDETDGVIGSQWSGDQYQIIIGQAVGDAYDAVCKKTGLAKQEAIDENLDGEKKKISVGAFFGVIAGCLTPLIPVLIGAGMLKAVLTIASQLGAAADNPTMVTLTFAADAAFYFLPILVGATAARKFNTDMGLGMALGALLVYPTFVESCLTGNGGSIFGISIYAGYYVSSIFPTIMAVYVMSVVKRFVGKYTPEVVRAMVEPLVTLLVMIPLTLCLIAPIGGFVGQALAAGMSWLTETAGWISIAVYACLTPVIIMTGMHVATAPVLLQNFATFGFDGILTPASLISNINQGIACLVVGLKTTNKKEKSTAFSSAVTAIVGGVTEPAMYGITLKKKKPLYCAMIGSFAGGLFAGIMKVRAYALSGASGIFALPVFIGNDNSLLFEVISILIGCAVTFILTYITYSEKEA